MFSRVKRTVRRMSAGQKVANLELARERMREEITTPAYRRRVVKALRIMTGREPTKGAIDAAIQRTKRELKL